jgi:hypothetical protein
MKFCRGLIVFLVGVSLLYAGEPWKSKTPDKWNKNDVEQILKNSPWGKTRATGEVTVREEDKTSSGGQRGSTSPQGLDVSKAPTDWVYVLWWSAKTPRRAMIRQIELGGLSVAPEQAKKFSESVMENHVISLVEIPERMRAAHRLTPEQLKQAAWLEIPSQKRKVDCVEAAVIKDAKGADERIIFQFPRQIDGQPVITAESKKVVFKWKLPTLAGGRGPGKGQEQQPAEIKMGDAKQFEVSFDVKKMVLNGELDD